MNPFLHRQPRPRCRTFETTDWIAFHTGEASGSLREAMEAHALTCRECVQERDAVRLLFAAGKSSESASTDDRLRESIWNRVRAEDSRPARSGWWRPVAAVGGVGIGMAGLLVAPTFLRRPTPVAFAQVEAAMASVDTVTWRESYDTSLAFFPDGRFRADRKLRHYQRWARMNPPTEVEVLRSGRVVRLADHTFQIFEEKGRSYYSYLRFGITGNTVFGPEKDQSPAERIRQNLLFPRNINDNGISTWEDKFRGAVKRAPWSSSEATLDGKTVLRFQTDLTYHQPLMNPDDPRAWRQTGETWTFFVEPQTYRLVRREVVAHYQGGGQQVASRSISDQFRYNVEPPEGIFDVTPAEGTRYSFVPLPQRRATPDEAEKIKSVISRAMTALRQHDIDSYLAQWDFDYEARSESDREQRRREEAQTARSISLRGVPSIMPQGTRISGIFVYHTGDSFPPKDSVEYLALVLAPMKVGQGRWYNGGFTINLHSNHDDFKIIRSIRHFAPGEAIAQEKRLREYLRRQLNQ